MPFELVVMSRRRSAARPIGGAAALLLILALASTPPAGAAVCSRGNAPAATLLIPYFEVDLDSPNGETTLVAIGSVASEPTLAKVTVWSDWAIAVYGFYVHLAPDAVQTFNLRDVVGQLQVPSLAGADPERFPGCFGPGPPFPAVFTAQDLQRRLTGRPDGEGLCHGGSGPDPMLAVGFLTVDVVRDCDLTTPNPALSTPLDASYGELALADNVLWGDVLFVEPEDDSAQGFSAVAVRADPSIVETGSISSFYPRRELQRVSPDETWRTRFLSGGPLDTSTELIVWTWDWSFGGGRDCNAPSPNLYSAVRWGPEGGPLEPADPPDFEPVGLSAVKASTRKVAIGELLGGDLPIAGSLELEAWYGCFFPCPGCSPCHDLVLRSRLPSVVWTTHRAAGRFSVGVEATPVEGSCRAEP